MIYNEIQLKAYFLSWILYGVQRLQRVPIHHYCVSENCVGELECTMQKVHLLLEELDMKEQNHENLEPQEMLVSVWVGSKKDSK